MKDINVDDLCEEVVKLSTHKRQLHKTIEELSEMIRAISRYLEDNNNEDNIDNIFEELSHSIVMLKQTEFILLKDLGDDKFFDKVEKWENNTIEDLEEVIEKLNLLQ